jgi:hypothetical protein
MLFGPSKISALVTGEALIIPYLFEEEFIIRGMGIVTGETLSLLQCSMHMRCLIHTQGHLRMTAITELVLFSELQGSYRNFSVPEMACFAIPLFHRRMNVLFLKFSQCPFVTIQAGLRREPSSHCLLRSARTDKKEDKKQEDKF